ncbi:MAG: peptidyl-prolyl cis-trans isomerase [Candidatus Sumerlaeaceae bacterium]|nr:peptidyl-prolyl cis-trans isomerase [Candidatus Sumerlaeaceae bacterium]
MRIRRKRRDGDVADGAEPPIRGLGKIPAGLLWTVLALVVLALFWGYDRREQKGAQEHIGMARKYVTDGLFEQALREYQLALDNPRLGRKAKAEVAVQMGNIYLTNFEDYRNAEAYYVRARTLDGHTFDNKETLANFEKARRNSAGPGAVASLTTATVLQQVALISPPQEDQKGPIVARMGGQDIHSGEIDRNLRNYSAYAGAVAAGDKKAWAEIVDNYMNQAAVYRAAMDAGYHKDPDVSRKLFDYQRSLVSERYMRDMKDKANVVANADVEAFYEKHREIYRDPERCSIALIKTETSATAQTALDALRAGTDFFDVATSYSVEKGSASTRGIAGLVSDRDDTVPGVGKAPEVAKTLLAMKPNDISGITKIGNAYYIFKVIYKSPKVEKTLDEVRPQIETTIRRQRSTSATLEMYSGLRQQYGAELQASGINSFWDSIAPKPDSLTTATAGGGRK